MLFLDKTNNLRIPFWALKDPLRDSLWLIEKVTGTRMKIMRSCNPDFFLLVFNHVNSITYVKETWGIVCDIRERAEWLKMCYNERRERDILLLIPVITLCIIMYCSSIKSPISKVGLPKGWAIYQKYCLNQNIQHTVISEALWCCNDAPACKSYSPDVREDACLVQISAKITSFSLVHFFSENEKQKSQYLSKIIWFSLVTVWN